MLLQSKTAMIFAATGAIGSAVARHFSAEGARVFLSGRDEAPLKRLAKELDAEWNVVDATDEGQVCSYIDQVSHQNGATDIVFNAIGLRASAAQYATLSTDIRFENFLLPLKVIVGSQFLTARAASRQMVPQHRGSIVMLSASLSGLFIPFMSGITAACGAIEAMTRTLAAEFGPKGVRVSCVRAGGMPETRTIQETLGNMASTTGTPVPESGQPSETNVLQRPLRIEKTARTIAFVASDYANGIAGQVINVCAGPIVSR